MIKNKDKVEMPYKNGILVYDLSSLPARQTIKEVYKTFLEKGVVLYASNPTCTLNGRECKNKPFVLNRRKKVVIADASKVIKKMNEEDVEKLLKKRNTENMIVWYVRGREVGRAYLPEGTMGLERDCIAHRVGVKKYDNFKFIAGDYVRLDANKSNIFGEPHGKYAGKQYEKRLKDKVFR